MAGRGSSAQSHPEGTKLNLETNLKRKGRNNMVGKHVRKEGQRGQEKRQLKRHRKKRQKCRHRNMIGEGKNRKTKTQQNRKNTERQKTPETLKI